MEICTVPVMESAESGGTVPDQIGTLTQVGNSPNLGNLG